jgi:uncharacterized protein
MPSQTKTKSCPMCRKAASPDHAPFCSQGCKDRDLLRWLDQGYKIPGPVVDPGVDSEEHDG